MGLEGMMQYFICGLTAGIILKLMVELIFYAVNSLVGIIRNIIS